MSTLWLMYIPSTTNMPLSFPTAEIIIGSVLYIASYTRLMAGFIYLYSNSCKHSSLASIIIMYRF